MEPGKQPRWKFGAICVLGAFLVLGLLSGRPAVAQGRVLVFAAASLKSALDELGHQWQERSGGRVVLSYAASSALARQIQQGAPADLFLSASIEWMAVLERDGLIRQETRRNLLRNRLILIAHQPRPALRIAPGFDLSGALGSERLAMALVQAVPAGIYGKQALTALGVWEQVQGQLAQVDNVRAALALVVRGEAPLGIVYASDAVAEPRVAVIDTFPEGSHAPILYPVAQTTESRSAAARDFLQFLTSETARTVFESQGFLMVQ